jgi:hypothetical protein
MIYGMVEYTENTFLKIYRWPSESNWAVFHLIFSFEPSQTGPSPNIET